LHADKITHKQFREEQRRLWDAANNRGSKFGERLAQVLTDEVRHRNERIDREDIRRERLERRYTRSGKKRPKS
jgi:predicted phage gp36 major capsid-like protein